jgi:hypothetical protein
MTFVGMYADTSPACVSIIGSAVKEPPGLKMVLLSTTPGSSLSLAARSSNREWR